MTPGGWLRDTAGLYRRVFDRGARLALRNWPVGLVVVVYGVVRDVTETLTAPLGLAGGLILYLVTVMCASSWLSLVAEVIRTGRVRLRDIPAGFTMYLNDLLTVFFILWGLSLIASIALGTFPLVAIVLVLAGLVFLNAIPELVYLGRHPPAQLLVESYRFIGENWIEWFPANLVLVACLRLVQLLPPGPFGLLDGTAVGIVLYFAMIVRGLLFQELATSSRRSREFRRRASA
jgi:hypothetical protein